MKHISMLIIFILFIPYAATAGDKLIVTKATKEVLLAGYTRNIKSQIVSSEISGRALKVNYDIGETIGGNAFIEIDPTFIEFQINSALHSLKGLEITIKKAKSRIAYLSKELSRIEELRKEDMATESRRDTISQNLDQARLALDSSFEERSILKTRLDELAERRNRHRIYAPPGWVVTDRNVEANENVQPGSPLAKVSDYRELVVSLYVSSEELSAIKSLPEIFDAELDGKSAKASINWINPEFNEKTRKLNIELIIKNYNDVKRGGLKLTLPVKVAAEGLYIPKSAVSMRYENPTAKVKHSGEVIQLLILGDAGDYLLVAEDNRLTPGIELMPSSDVQQSVDK